jgi:voltage-gated potassium channel
LKRQPIRDQGDTSAVPTPPHQHVQRAGRELFQVVRGSTATHAHLRDRVLSIAWVTVLMALVSSLAIYLVERHAQSTQIHNIFDAALYTTSHLLTAGSVATPTTTAGKVLQLCFDVYAITVIAALAGSFGAFFHRRGKERDEAEGARLASKHRS